ncbi:MAG: hypothetical protein MI919_12505, partial [Holophagales bacterium]|nr:hypothetical protein [Holophagales bacterium]
MKLRRHKHELVSRLSLLLRIAQALLVLIAVRYWMVQVVNGESYRELADHNRLRKQSIEASRGLILDRGRMEDSGRSSSFAGAILDAESTEIEHGIVTASGPRFRPVLLGRDLSLAQLSRFAVHSLEHPEFEVRTDQLRLYRYAHQMAHVLGYLGEVSDTELDQEGGSYRPGDLVGRKGIEYRYESLLRGRSGERVVVVDSRGRIMEGLDDYEHLPAEAGRNVRLSLDLDLQQEAARLLEGKVGAIVAMDPRNGEILAMVSAPSFDPNLFARRLDEDQWRQLIGNRHHPLQNRAVQNTYPPGSGFKVV